MSVQMQHFQLPDGRNLDYSVSGASDGIPLVWIHGTPGAGIPVPNVVKTCSKKGIKVISVTRAGYGGSTRKKGRRIVDMVADIHALNEHLGIKKCLVGGWSGGGPHSLACAARLPGCVAALCVAGVAPYNVEGLDFLAGQGKDNIAEYGAAFEGEDALRKFCLAARSEMLQADLEGVLSAFSTLLPPVDNNALLANRDTMGQNMVDTIQEGLKNGVDGWIDDDMSFINPWGFELSEVKVPVLLYQGDEDKMVPYAHGQWLVEHLPKDKLKAHLVEGQGHISIFANVEDVFDELLALAKL